MVLFAVYLDSSSACRCEMGIVIVFCECHICMMDNDE